MRSLQIVITAVLIVYVYDAIALANEKPNFLFLLVDDQRPDTLMGIR